MNDIKVTIIIPVYNVEKYINECVDSIIQQSYYNLEILLIDDGSTDNSLKILKQYSHKDTRIKILTQKNKGAAIARNFGLSIATGKYVIFLDSDDYFETTLIKKSVDKAEEFNADIVIFKAKAFDNNTGQTSALNDRISKLHKYQEKIFSYKDMPEDIFNSFLIAPWNKLYLKEFLEKHKFQFQNVKRSNDLLFTSKTLVAAEKIILLNEVLVNYRVGLTKNLQSGNDKTPLEFYKALVALKNYLEEQDLYQDIYKSYIKMALEVIFYNLNSLKRDEQFYQILQFFKEEGFQELKINESKEMYKLSSLCYLQYYCATSDGILKNVNILRLLYKIFKIKQYYETAGISGTIRKVKQKLIIRSRKEQCK